MSFLTPIISSARIILLPTVAQSELTPIFHLKRVVKHFKILKTFGTILIDFFKECMIIVKGKPKKKNAPPLAEW